MQILIKLSQYFRKYFSTNIRGEFKDKCDSVCCTSVGGFTEAQEGSFNKSESKQHFLEKMYLPSNYILMLKNLRKVTYHWAPDPIWMEKKLRKKSSVKNVAILSNKGFSNKCYKKEKVPLVLDNTMLNFYGCRS